MRKYRKGELKSKLVKLWLEHPDWTKPQFASELGTSLQSVKNAMNLYLMKAPDGRRNNARNFQMGEPAGS